MAARNNNRNRGGGSSNKRSGGGASRGQNRNNTRGGQNRNTNGNRGSNNNTIKTRVFTSRMVGLKKAAAIVARKKSTGSVNPNPAGGSKGSAVKLNRKRNLPDLRQLIPKKNPNRPKTAGPKPTAQLKKDSIKKRLGLISKSKKQAIAAERRKQNAPKGQASRNSGGTPKVTIISNQPSTSGRQVQTGTTTSGRQLVIRNAATTAGNTASAGFMRSKNRVWRRREQNQIVLSQPPTVIIAAPPSGGPSSSRSSGGGLSLSSGGNRVGSGNSVVISNLSRNVTSKDIMELFGDIGSVTGYQQINDSTAMVTFNRSNDASEAVETYHNRFLDGIPMQCTLIPSTASTSGSSLSSSSAMITTSPNPGQQRFVSRALHQALY